MFGLRVISIVLWTITGLMALSAVILAMTDGLRGERKIVLLCVAGLFGAFAWGMNKRRPWAWEGVVTVALVLVCISPLMFASASSASNPGPVYAIVGLCVGCVTLAGSYLILPRVRAAFPRASTEKHVWLRLIAAQFVLSALLYLVRLSGDSETVFGFRITGVWFRLYTGAWGSLSLLVGINLYRKLEWARRWAIGIIGFGIAQSVFWAANEPVLRSQSSIARMVAATLMSLLGIAGAAYLQIHRKAFISAPGDAREVRRVVGAALPVPSGNLRIGTQRPRAIYCSVRRMRGDDLLRRSTLHDPRIDCAQRIEAARPRTTIAVAHSRRHEKAEER